MVNKRSNSLLLLAACLADCSLACARDFVGRLCGFTYRA